MAWAATQRVLWKSGFRLLSHSRDLTQAATLSSPHFRTCPEAFYVPTMPRPQVVVLRPLACIYRAVRRNGTPAAPLVVVVVVVVGQLAAAHRLTVDSALSTVLPVVY